MKNNAFKKTFYFGLITLLFFVGIILIITINVYTLTSKHDNKLNDTVNNTEYQQVDSIGRTYVEPTIILDTIKPIVIVKPKVNVINNIDTTIVLSDTTNVLSDTTK